MKIKYVTSIVLFIAAAVLAPQALAQANGENSPANRSSASSSAQVKPAADFPGHYLWTEQFDGSINSEGHVMELDSTVGYVFSRHFGVDGGIPVYFVRDNSTTSTGGMTTT
ncbi:MAG TPA: hypothetical protein VGU63_00945, partial [Candidatus Acidoferrales bacterium]|nr:hypothetical protein [Candidatus Acidoferrales bacterium]